MKIRWSLLGKVFIRTSQLSGLMHYGLDLKYNKWLKYYTGILIIAFFLSFVQTIFRNDLPTIVEPTGFQLTIAGIQNVGIRICHLGILLESLIRSQQTLSLVKREKEMENYLNSIVGLGDKQICAISEGLKKLFWIGLYYFLITLSSLVLMFIGDVYILALGYWMLYTISFSVSSIRYLQLTVFIHSIYYHMQTLRNFLPKLNLKEKETKQAWHIVIDDSSKDTENINFDDHPIDAEDKREFTVDESFAKLEKIRYLYNQLWIFSNDISHYFGVSTLMNLAYVLICVTGNMFWLISCLLMDLETGVSKFATVVGTLVWMSPYFINFYCVSSMSYWTNQIVCIDTINK